MGIPTFSFLFWLEEKLTSLVLVCGSFVWDTIFSYFNCPFDFLLHGEPGREVASRRTPLILSENLILCPRDWRARVDGVLVREFKHGPCLWECDEEDQP